MPRRHTVSVTSSIAARPELNILHLCSQRSLRRRSQKLYYGIGRLKHGTGQPTFVLDAGQLIHVRAYYCPDHCLYHDHVCAGYFNGSHRSR